MTRICRARSLRTSLVVGLAALVGLPTAGRSEDQTSSPSPLAVGARVRVTAPTVLSDRATGVIIGIDEKSLLILADDHRLTVPRQSIVQLEVSTGKRRRTLKGLMFGAGLGAVIFPPAIYGSCLSDCGSKWDAGYILAGAAFGAVCGAGIGALLKTDRWAIAPAQGVRLSLYPSRTNGLRVSLSVAF